MMADEKEDGEYTPLEDGKPVMWWKSKKFTAYMIGDMTWKLIIFACLYIIATVLNGEMTGAMLTFMFAVVVTAGVAEMGFLGGQTWIDRYTKAIKIPAQLGVGLVGKMGKAFGGKGPELPEPPELETEPEPEPEPDSMDDEEPSDE
jgi:hypothetical protein